MPRSKVANQEIREKTRNLILDSAKIVFSKKGFTATMNDIAIEANISQGLAYRYFRSKESLLIALVEQMLQSRDNLYNLFQNITGSPFERLKIIIAKLLKHRVDNPGFFQIYTWIMTTNDLPEDIQQKMKDHSETTNELLINLIVEGQKSGEISKDDPQILLRLILSFLNGISLIPLISEHMDFIQLSDLVMRVFIQN